MKVFTLICALLVIAAGAGEFYGWGGEGEGPRTLISAIPAFFGAAMLLGTLVAFFFRRTGLQIAFLVALSGGFAGLGRLAPSYLKETLDWKEHPANLIVAMSSICLAYVLVAAFVFLFVRRKPVVDRLTEAENLSQELDEGMVVEEKDQDQEQEQEQVVVEPEEGPGEGENGGTVSLPVS